jgi:hypothetical protein
VTALTIPGILRRAEQAIAGHWSRTGYEYRSGRYCPVEALGAASGGLSFEHPIFKGAYRALQNQIGSTEVATWNGRPERTEAEVRAALLAAAQAAEAGDD